MTSPRKARTGPDKQAARRRDERRLAAAPLLHGNPPFGGYKASGVGRQNGIEGFQQYTEVKTYAVGVPS